MRATTFAVLAVLVAVLVGALAGCGAAPEPIETTDLAVRVRLGKTSVAPGEGIPVEVVRVWSKTLEPSPWDDAMLSPLVVEHVATTRREDGARVEETRRLRGYAFTREDVTVPAVPFAGRPRAGGALQLTATRPFVLQVLPAVDAEAPGAPELPGAPAGASFPWLALAMAVAALVLAVAGWRSRGAPTRGEAVGAISRALGALDRPRLPPSEVAAVVRAFVRAHYGLPAPRRTTEEVREGLPAAAGPGFGELLATCDRAKFGAWSPAPGEAQRLVEDARRLVRAATRPLP